MVIVDTGVWIDFFNDKSTPQVETLVRAIQNRDYLKV
jgi:predicted nucleic acid-binding protein